MKQILFLLVSVIGVYCKFEETPQIDIFKLSKNAGYQVDSQEIATEDGYLLDIFRIKRSPNSSNKKIKSKHPVLLMHGLLGSAENYVLLGNKSLAFLLVENGFDVWLGNGRGTWHSRKHKKLDPDRDEEYWKFTWNEMGKYDLPAMVDHILNVTHQKKLSYLGHSQGTTIFLVMTSVRPEYNEKIAVGVLLAPAAYMKFNDNPIVMITSSYFFDLKKLAKTYSVYEFQPIFRNHFMYNLANDLCMPDKPVSFEICKGVIFAITTISGNECVRDDMFPVMIGTAPAGSSVYQPLHFLQNSVLGGEFAQYDWGREINLRKYNSLTPSAYNVSRITAPVAIFYGKNDALVHIKDSEILKDRLPNLVEFAAVPHEKWAHLDFIVADNVVPMVYDRVIKILKKYSKR